jgi:hypothetical protein
LAARQTIWTWPQQRASNKIRAKSFRLLVRTRGLVDLFIIARLMSEDAGLVRRVTDAARLTRDWRILCAIFGQSS